MISIYKNYDTSSLVLDKPCVVDGIGTFYPVRVKDYIEMQEYGSFLIYNKKYFGLKKDEELLEMVIMANTMSICKDINNEKLFKNSSPPMFMCLHPASEKNSAYSSNKSFKN